MNGDKACSIKRKIEPWKEVVIVTDSVLSWEKEWYPAVTSGSLSLLFLLVWYQDPSMLTLLSILGLVVTLLDYVVPKLQAKLFPESCWSAEQEKKLDRICKDLMFVETGIRRVYYSVFEYKQSSPKLYLTIVVVSLFLMAHLGAIFSGFFLAYITLLTICMTPGLHRRGLLEKYCSGIILKISDFVKAKKLE